MLRFFPPLVTGTVITVIGVSLFPIAVMWLSGDRGMGAQDTAPAELWLGLATMLGGLLNAFPFTTFSQNVGIMRVSGARISDSCQGFGFPACRVRGWLWPGGAT